MKHFFFPYDKNHDNTNDKLNSFIDEYLFSANEQDGPDDETLKVYYDVTDIIYDKRFEQSDSQFQRIINKHNERNKKDGDTEKNASQEDKDNSDQKKNSRHYVLELLMKEIEKHYKKFSTYSNEILCRKNNDTVYTDQQYDTLITLALYHLVRGNLCQRISLCCYENFDLDASDDWADKGIEIFWHGKNLMASLRDTVVSEDKRIQADLYLRLFKLNLAKYYRNYARKNRRSDYDAALDEFKQVRRRVEEEYGNVRNVEQRRQYALIWMDAIINIVKIHRRKYQVNISEQEMLFLYNCLKRRLQLTGSLESHEDSPEATPLIQELLEKADKIVSFTNKYPDITDNKFLEQNKDLMGLKIESFDKYDDLRPFDRLRYFLLILLELTRIWRDLHFVDNYNRAIALAIIADQWSHNLDRIEYVDTIGHNIDALITISSSLRKYIKFQNTLRNKKTLQLEIKVEIDGNEYSLKRQDSTTQTYSMQSFIEELSNFSNNGNLKSKAEVIKWHCLYQQEPELLCEIKEQVAEYPYDKGDSNCQLQFLEGLADLRSENYKKAIEKFTELLEKNEKEMRYIRLGTLGLKVRYLLANCYMAQAEFSKAEIILKKLQDELAVARESRENQAERRSDDEKSVLQTETKKDIQQVKESTDADPDARVEIDLGYCYMQRGDYEEGMQIYKKLYGDGNSSEHPRFGLENVKLLRRIMGLNNYASCCIFSMDDIDEEMSQDEKYKIINDNKKKIEIVRRIFNYMDDYFYQKNDEQSSVWYELNPETNLLKGYYTLYTGIEPRSSQLTDEEFNRSQGISESKNPNFQSQALLNAFKFFRKACMFGEAFPSRYDLLDKQGRGNKARYRNEVERISVYIISLTKLQKLYMNNQECINEQIEELKKHKEQQTASDFSLNDLTITEEQLNYLASSTRDLERFLLGLPENYKISLKAAIALAEWLIDSDDRANKNKNDKKMNLQKQLYRSFSYITIYEERGAGVFNTLKGNGKFRFFNAAQRGKFCALLLAMYKPIKMLKENCCFNIKDKKNNQSLVHYTSMKTLKKILTDDPQNEKPAAIQKECSKINDSDRKKQTEPRFQINNCGYMNDVFEGKAFFKSIALAINDITTANKAMQSSIIEKYFPQINRSPVDLLPSGSNVYIGSLSVKADSFPMWSVYSKKESGCNIEFGDGFFDINGIPYQPKALRDYMLSKYTDQDYPLYIVQYIGSKFNSMYNAYMKEFPVQKLDFETFHTGWHQQSCETRAIRYNDLFRILRQIASRWMQLDDYLEDEKFANAVSESKNVIRAFAADRINEIRFLFKDADYEYEGEVRVIYTDSAEHFVAKNDTSSDVPRVYVDIDRDLEKLTIGLGSRIDDATVDKYVTWLKHTNRVEKVVLAKQNRYTT